MASEAPVANKCGAKLRRSEERFGKTMYCENDPIPGRPRCKFHGGKSLSGADHPNYKGRGYSKDIPTRLRERFEAALEDPNLISLQSEIALMDARLGEVFTQLPTGETGEAWDRINTALGMLRKAFVEGNQNDMEMWLKDAEKACGDANAEASVWGQVYGLIGERRKLADTERKREEMLSGNMTTRQAMTFVTAVQTAILEEVHDQETRRRLALRMQFLLGVSENPANQHISKHTLGGQVNADTLQALEASRYEDVDYEVVEVLPEE